MPIPFDDTDNDSSDAAGYLKFLHHAAKNIWLGALFVMNARGEPIEFTHARVRSPKAMLWRTDDLRARCQLSLCTSLFDLCPITPDIILCLADEVASDIFTQRLRLEIPIGFVTRDGHAAEWTMDISPDSTRGRLFKCLSERGLLLEPFERAETGLREVYSELLK